MLRVTAVGIVVALLATAAWVQAAAPPVKKSLTPEALKAEIEALKADKVVWREIAWKSCLIEGLKESRQKKKPVLLWIFIDRPADDARCWVFAGAAREAVFSKPDVIKRVNADFIPVALKAALVNRPPDDDEGLLYREIARSKPAPQGICVVNSAGKVLTWTLMFDDDKSVLAFFDHAGKRYAKFPDAKKPVAAEVYEKFPSKRRKDVEDSGKVLPVLDRHPKGKHCPAEPPLPRGTVAVRLFGRALGKDGKPVADVVRQENYAEDRFNIAVQTQEKLAKALADAGKGPVKLPPEVARQWVKQAYMGVLDVQPLDNPSPPGGSKGELKKCNFSATKVGDSKGPTLWRVEGESEAFIDEKMANGGPGDMHEVKLTWHGFIEMDGDRMTRLVLSAGGKEKLKFQSARGKVENEVAILPGGHRIDMNCEVRFGIIGEAVPPERKKERR